jgi:beta-galactosidase/beta-glucuronidase
MNFFNVIKDLLKRLCLIMMLLLIIIGLELAAAGETENQIPRPEHPKPQFLRDSWLNLNGQWNFAFDFDLSGIEKGWPNDPSGLDKKITVPFCPESKLSGIEYTDFIRAVWYHRTFSTPADWKGKRIFLHFGGVDYDCQVWVNGKLVGRHYGGAVSFSFEITDALRQGDNDLVVYAIDDTQSGVQPLGKQNPKPGQAMIKYTRVTGIWQTVWLETRPQNFLESVNIVPDLDNNRFLLTPVFDSYQQNLEFRATLLSADGDELKSVRSSTSGMPVSIEINNPIPWSPDNPYLYKLRLELHNEKEAVDLVNSYAGLRKFHIEGNTFYLNNEPIFLRMVLDQGYYPDGIWTAPSDKELKADIERAMKVGFNGGRLHQKVFEERFHYWADYLGYLTWGEFPSWGMDIMHKIENPASPGEAIWNFQREWRQAVIRDRNHPSIITWTPLNETGGGARTNLELHRRVVQGAVDLTRVLDPTRPICDASGHSHVDTDIYGVHDYENDEQVFQDRMAAVDPDKPETVWRSDTDIQQPYTGQPYVVAEYGGTFWTDEHPTMDPAEDPFLSDWGYGKTSDQFLEHLEELTTVLIKNPNIAGFCYTQLYDIERERNGMYTYNRKLKFNAERLKKIFGEPARLQEN